MISIISIKLAPLLIALLHTKDDKQAEDGIENSTNTFRPNPALQTSVVPGTFSQLLELQKVYGPRGASNTTELIDLYKHWNAEIIKMMDCTTIDKNARIVIRVILRVESVDEAALNVLTILPRIIESEYQQRVRGSECRKQAGLKAGKAEEMQKREDDGHKAKTEDQEATSGDESRVAATKEATP